MISSDSCGAECPVSSTRSCFAASAMTASTSGRILPSRVTGANGRLSPVDFTCDSESNVGSQTTLP